MFYVFYKIIFRHLKRKPLKTGVLKKTTVCMMCHLQQKDMADVSHRRSKGKKTKDLIKSD